MYNAIYCEFLKLKKSPIFIGLIIGGIADPVLMFLGQIYRQDIVKWNHYMSNIECMTSLMIGLIFFTLVSAYVYAREFTEKVTSITYSYPISKTKILISKLIMVFACILFVYILQFVISVILGCILNHEPLYKEVLILHAKIYFYSMIFQFTITPLAIFISSISKGVVIPIIYSVLGTLINSFIINSEKYRIYFPLDYPILPIMSLKSSNMDLTLNKYTFIIAIAFFIIMTSASIFYYEKCDIE